MPRSAGVYAAPASSWNPAINGQPATTADWIALLQDICTAISQSIAVDGSTTTTALVPFAQGVQIPPGALATPALQVIGDPTTGLYQPAAGSLTFVCEGTTALSLSSTAVSTTLPVTVQNFTAAGNASLGGAAGTLGFYGSAGTAKPTIAGSKASGAAFASLLAALVAMGLVTDGTSA